MKTSLQHTHIPTFDEPDWPSILATSIQENGDELVKIEPSERMKCRSMYFEAKIEGSLPDIWLRKNVVHRLGVALNFLPKNLGILLLDGWRPYEVQMALRNLVAQDLKDSQPHLSDVDLLRLLNQFVAEPRQQLDSPSPHLTGGSVDLTLFDVETGEILNMGTDFDSPEPESWTAAFEGQANDEVIQHRRYLYNAMILSGFTNLPTEWWHFDFGNQLWAYYSNEPYAMYSATSMN